MIHLIFLGTGTSTGVPLLGCQCPVCTSQDPKDQRLRTSAFLKWDQYNIQIDVGPDFRLQALKHRITQIDLVLLTHTHADHVNGLDDLRPLSYCCAISVYYPPNCLSVLQKRYDYMFGEHVGPTSRPNLKFLEMPPKLKLDDRHVITAVPIFHGEQLIFGYRFGPLAYLTDCSQIPPDSYAILQGVSVVIIGALRPTQHPTHFSFDQALQAVKPLNPKQVYFIHLSHDVLHAEIAPLVAHQAQAAYDGQELHLP